MLELFRRQGQVVHLYLEDGRRIVVQVNQIRNYNVSLKIWAPPEVGVVRAEVDNQN